MPNYDYLCSKCDQMYEIRHEMSCDDDFMCTECDLVLEKQISSTFYVFTGIGPTWEDRKDAERKKKVKDPERAVRMRKKAFGKDSVGDPSMKSDPKHIIKRGRALAGQNKEVDKQAFIKAAAKDDTVVETCQKVLKKSGGK